MEDPRTTINRQHPLGSVVVIALMAVQPWCRSDQIVGCSRSQCLRIKKTVARRVAAARSQAYFQLWLSAGLIDTGAERSSMIQCLVVD